MTGLRLEFRDWLSHALPDGWFDALDGDRIAFELMRAEWDEVAWHRAMGEAGYLGVHWPTEFGGRGMTWADHYATQEELARAEVPLMGLSILAVGLCAPTIAKWGTDEQKQRYLPGIISGRDIWCQLFSEPAAGSDLAGLRTRALRRDDGDFGVTGQKVWTSLAQHARYGMLLARTDPDQPKHKGLTWFVAPLQDDNGDPAPGADIRPLRMITGDANFNEVFLDDMTVPAENIVGAENDGWNVVRTTLMAERMAISGVAFDQRGGIEATIELARDRGATDGPARDRVIRLYLQSVVRETLSRRAIERKLGGLPDGPEESVSKILMAKYNQSRTELELDVLGAHGMLLDSTGELTGIPGAAKSYLRARANSIEGGTTEILKNVLAERVLKLPR